MIFYCPECGLKIDRDLNAAINNIDFATFRVIRKDLTNTVGTAGSHAHGVQSIYSRQAMLMRKLERRSEKMLRL